MRAPAEGKLPFMDIASCPASVDKATAVWLALPHSRSTAGAETHPRDFPDRHSRHSPAQ
ncbi:hypothetical protein ABVT39_025658, partial [Epinephelus coioides]